MSSMAEMFQAQPGAADTGDSEDSQEKYGVDKKTAEEIERLNAKYAFTEGMSGGNDEARLCMKKLSWLDCEDYAEWIKVLSQRESERLRDQSTESKLKFRMHFAESDIMIGKGGQKYFEQCWKQEGVSEVVDVESKEWPGSNHETVLLDFNKGAVRSVFEEIRSLH